LSLKEKKLILIDGNALLYRSFYALPPLTTGEGIPTGGVYGFTRILLKLLREEKPDYLACAFDKGKKTFRHRRWEEYKATRPKTPPALSQQIPLTKDILAGFNVPVFEEEEYEADDLLATLAKEGEKTGLKVEVFTGDKDILQIVSPSISIIRFKKGISQNIRYPKGKGRIRSIPRTDSRLPCSGRRRFGQYSRCSRNWSDRCCQTDPEIWESGRNTG